MLKVFQNKSQVPPRDIKSPEETSWLQRMGTGLQKSSGHITDGIIKIFNHKKLNQVTLTELEELLILADLGPSLAARLAQDLSKEKFGKEITGEEVRLQLASQMAEILSPVAVPLAIPENAMPFVILVVGVNGAGKTTTIGKFAQKFHSEGRRVLLAAGDTFRAAAIEQLEAWADRIGVPVFKKQQGADSAALVHGAVEAALQQKYEVLIIDTAGRLQNKQELMAELAKVIRVIKRQLPAAPHATLLVLDGTTGQNAISQTKVFQEMINVSGLVVTKLDGTAKAGVVVALAQQFGLPIHAIGVGEQAEDLSPFDAQAFARSLLRID